MAVVYYSGYGHTKVVAEHIAIGAKSAGAEAVLFNVNDQLATAQELEILESFDAIVFGSPTYMGALAWQLKKFMDSTSSIWAQRKWENKIAAGFTNSAGMSGDKLNTLFTLSIFAAQHGMIWVGSNSMGQGLAQQGQAVNRLSSWLGLMTQANANDGPDIAPPIEDRKASEAFGARIAAIANKMHKNG